jgi:ribonuclease G
VVRVLPGMQSAFIDIGLERAAFLHVADIWEARGHDGQNATPAPIEKILFDGQVLMVQVIKDPIGTKGARLSTQISIAGRMLVYLPQDKHIGISQKIERKPSANAARAPAKPAAPDEKAATSCAPWPRTPDADLPADIAYLRKTWAPSRTARARARHQPAAPGPEPGAARAARLRRRRNGHHPGRLARELRETARIRGIYTPSVLPRCSTTRASARCSTCTASKRRSCARWAAAST